MTTPMRFGVRLRTRPAFTLVELLVVIALLGLLASLLLPALARARRAAKTGARLSNLHQIALAMELYIQENGNRLPSCSALPSLSTSNLPPSTVFLMEEGDEHWQLPAGSGRRHGTSMKKSAFVQLTSDGKVGICSWP